MNLYHVFILFCDNIDKDVYEKCILLSILFEINNILCVIYYLFCNNINKDVKAMYY